MSNYKAKDKFTRHNRYDSSSLGIDFECNSKITIELVSQPSDWPSTRWIAKCTALDGKVTGGRNIYSSDHGWGAYRKNYFQPERIRIGTEFMVTMSSNSGWNQVPSIDHFIPAKKLERKASKTILSLC